MSRGKWLAIGVALVSTLLLIAFVYATAGRHDVTLEDGYARVFPDDGVAPVTGALSQQSEPTPTAIAHLRPVSPSPIDPSAIGRIVPIVARLAVNTVLPTRYNTNDGLPPGGEGYALPNDRWFASAEVFPVVFDVVEYLRGDDGAIGWVAGPSQAYTSGVALDDGRLSPGDELICFFAEVESTVAGDPRFDYLLSQAAALSHESNAVRVAELSACYEIALNGQDTTELISGASFPLVDVLAAMD